MAHFNGTEAQPANQPELQQPASRSAAIRLLATLYGLQLRASSTSHRASSGGVPSYSCFAILGRQVALFLPLQRPTVCVASPSTSGIGGTSVGSQPTTYSLVLFLARCPHQFWSITSVQPPCSSRCPISGKPATRHSVVNCGCSSTPPKRRTCAMARCAKSFSPLRDFEAATSEAQRCQ